MTTDLRPVLEATESALAADPAAAAAHFEVAGQLVGDCEVAVHVGDRVVTIDQPAPLGTDRGPNPVQLALAALGACQAMTYRVWSEKLQIPFDELRLEVRGGVDVRRFFGVDDTVRAGFGAVEVDVHLAGPETPERYEELRRAVDAHCPVLDVFADPVPVRTVLAGMRLAQAGSVASG